MENNIKKAPAKFWEDLLYFLHLLCCQKSRYSITMAFVVMMF